VNRGGAHNLLNRTLTSAQQRDVETTCIRTSYLPVE
jgi:hypothetical protein